MEKNILKKLEDSGIKKDYSDVVNNIPVLHGLYSAPKKPGEFKYNTGSSEEIDYTLPASYSA